MTLSHYFIVFCPDNETEEYHAITFSYSAPVEIEILPSSLILIRSMSSVNFEMNVYLGPKPSDIINQIQGDTFKQHPPYWALGVHICRNTADKDLLSTTAEIELLLENNSIPFDSHCIQENLLALGNITLDGELMNSIDLLKNASKKIIYSVISQVRYINSNNYKKSEDILQ